MKFPSLLNNPLSFDNIHPFHQCYPLVGSSTLAARHCSWETKALAHSSKGGFQPVDAAPLIRHSVLEPCELKGIAPSPVRAQLIHQMGKSSIKQMLHHIVMELGVLAIFVVLELAEHTELLQGGIEEGSIDPGCIVTHILEACCLHL